jgi:hypothetical protein
MFRKTLLLIFLAVSIVHFSGCVFLAAGAAGAGTVKWLSDKATQVVDSPVDKAAKAASAALLEMKIVITKVTRAPDVTQLLGKDSSERQVWVDLRPLDAKMTTIGVRVGYLNGEKDAAKILQKIVSKTKSWM